MFAELVFPLYFMVYSQQYSQNALVHVKFPFETLIKHATLDTIHVNGYCLPFLLIRFYCELCIWISGVNFLRKAEGKGILDA